MHLMNIRSVSTWPLHTPNGYSVSICQTPPYTEWLILTDPSIHRMNIQSVSAWLLHTPNRYWVSICLTPAYTESILDAYPPDPCIHWINIGSVSASIHRMNIGSVSAYPLHTPNVYWVSIHLTPAYTKWIFGQFPPDFYIHPINIGCISAWPLHTPNEY